MTISIPSYYTNEHIMFRNMKNPGIAPVSYETMCITILKK